jgi:hypothetical protein
MNKITFVTGLWDIGRGNLDEGWSRSFEHYLDKFKELLKVEENLIIYGDEELRVFVEANRPADKTQFILRDLSWFKNNEYFNTIQRIRTNPDWYNLAGWLKDSTQAKLEFYNPLVMSKMFLLNDAKCMDTFDSEYMFWIDAGLANTVHSGYFTHDKVFDKLPKYISKFSFVCFPYEANTEVHGFEYNKLNSIACDKIIRVARGGFFGGPKHTISDINSLYYNLLINTLNDGYMGTEESLFSILCYKHSDLINYFDIKDNGFISTFFENLKNDKVEVKSESKITKINNLNVKQTSLYVLTFNSPKQFRRLLESFKQYDKNFLDQPRKILLDNSTDKKTLKEYKALCAEYGFEHIRKNNLGICGGRQFIAEHFDESDSDYMFFFEDDMLFYLGEDVCKNGFKRIENQLYTKSLEIINKEDLDFLKLNFSEFYGDNSTQWAWYNVPQTLREQYWPEKSKLPVSGLDPNAPKTNFNTIKSYKRLPYALGEVYYCNWPQIVSKAGSKKMFLDTKWTRPYEQTWMSHMFQLTIKKELASGVLLLTPTEHDRFDFYSATERKES